MSKTIRFLGGPADQELRAVPDNIDRVVFMELQDSGMPAVLDESEPDEVVPIIYHEYLRAFSGASYFKYQGKVIREKEIHPWPGLLGMRWFRE